MDDVILLGVIIIGALAVIAIIVGMWQAARSSETRRTGREQAKAAQASGRGMEVDLDRPRPPLDEFHVRGEDALVYFGVPLPDRVDDVLRDLLVREAVEVLRDKRSHGLPLDVVRHVRAFGVRDGARVEAGSLTLEEPGELPSVAAADLVPRAARAGYDPLGEMVSGDFPEGTPGIVETARRETLAPIASEIRLTGLLEAGLRTQGVDPETMTAGQLVLGLLRVSGYTVSAGGSEATFIAVKEGARTFVRVVDHVAGEYPEIPERRINEFIVEFVSSGTDRGLLISDKYGPFVMYEKERREPRVHFLTRERLQHFVDALAVR